MCVPRDVTSSHGMRWDITGYNGGYRMLRMQWDGLRVSIEVDGVSYTTGCYGILRSATGYNRIIWVVMDTTGRYYILRDIVRHYGCQIRYLGYQSKT